jgi:hypothetical protein
MDSFNQAMIKIGAGSHGKYVLYEEAQKEIEALQAKVDSLREVIRHADSHMSLLRHRGKPDDLAARIEIEKTLAALRRIAGGEVPEPSKLAEVLIDHKFYSFGNKARVTGADLRAIAHVPDSHDLWMEGQTGISQDDLLVLPDAVLSMKDGMSFYSAPREF